MIFLSRDEKEDQERGHENRTTYSFARWFDQGWDVYVRRDVYLEGTGIYHLKAKMRSIWDMKSLQNPWTLVWMYLVGSHTAHSQGRIWAQVSLWGLIAFQMIGYRDEIIYKIRWEVEFGTLHNINIWKVDEEEFIICIYLILDNNLWGQGLYYSIHY